MSHRLTWLGSLLLLGLARQAHAQATPAADSTRPRHYTYTETMPVFPAQERSDSARTPMQRVMHYLNKDLHFPAKALRDGVQGKVFFAFVVNSQGQTANIKLVKGLRDDVDTEVLRVAHRLDSIRWRPGTQNGRPVQVAFTVPITFSVNLASQPGGPADSLDLGPYHKLVLPLASWSGNLAHLPAGKGLVYGSCLQRLGTNGFGLGQYVRLANLTTHKSVRINVKPTLKSRRENAFCYALPAGRYALLHYEFPDPVWGAYRLHVENLRKPQPHQLPANLHATRYLFTVEAGQVHYLGTWNLANENEPIFLDEKAALDAELQPAYPDLPLQTARTALPR